MSRWFQRSKRGWRYIFPTLSLRGFSWQYLYPSVEVHSSCWAVLSSSFHSLQVLATPSDQVEPNGSRVFFRLELATGCIFIFPWFPCTYSVWSAFIRLSHPLCWTILWTIFSEQYRPLLIFCFYGREHKRTEISWVGMIDCWNWKEVAYT